MFRLKKLTVIKGLWLFFIVLVLTACSSSSDITEIVDGLAGILVSPECSSNPLAGFAVVQEIGIGEESIPLAAQAVFTFENECDAGIRVIAATGNFIAANFSELDFDLNLP